jgi:hypothetical protein
MHRGHNRDSSEIEKGIAAKVASVLIVHEREAIEEDDDGNVCPKQTKIKLVVFNVYVPTIAAIAVVNHRFSSLGTRYPAFVSAAHSAAIAVCVQNQ